MEQSRSRSLFEPLDAQESLIFLLQRAKLLQSGMPLFQIALSERHAAQAIVEEMDSLPLALDQAGAYIEETQGNVESYLLHYRQRRAALLERRGQYHQDHPASVQTTLSFAFQQIEQKSPVAAEVLLWCAFLTPDAIPEALIRMGFASDSISPHRLVADFWMLDEALAMLGGGIH